MRFCSSAANVGPTTVGSTSRMLAIVPALAASASVVASETAWYCWIEASAMSYADRVASMLRVMYGLSLSTSVGRTCSCCTSAG